MSEASPPPFDDIERLLRAEDLAERLQLSIHTIWDMNRDGILPRPLKLGRAVRWRVRDFNAWVERRALAAAAGGERKRRE